MGYPRHHLIVNTALLTLWLATISAQDQTQAASPTGLLCISECVTCPVICSSPPSPIRDKPPPPPTLLSPALPKPPKCPPSPPKLLAPPPPRFIYSFGGMPPPPPPRVYYGVFPAPPNGKGRPEGYEYPYPYFAYYSSGVPASSSLSQPMLLFGILMLLMVIGS